MDKLLSLVALGEAIPVAWDIPVLLNQGTSNHCVGFAGAHFESAARKGLESNPKVDDIEGHRLYYEAKRIDGSPESEMENGTYLRALAKVLKNEGVIKAYSITCDREEVNAWLQNWGIAILGTVWYKSMFSPASDGTVGLSGGIAGGHAYVMRGDKQAPADNLCRNSWGTWGIGGDFYLTEGQLYQLLSQEGEALLAVRYPITYKRGCIGGKVKFAFQKMLRGE
jgi:hypothetical protein